MNPAYRAVVLTCAGLGVCLMAPLTARAEPGERALGLALEGGYPAFGRLTLVLEEGLSSWLAARFEIGGQARAVGWQPEGWRLRGEGVATLGLVAAFDVFAWVPEVYLGGGGAAGPDGLSARLVARTGVRTYLDPEWSLGIALGGEWIPAAEATLGLGFTVWWHPF